MTKTDLLYITAGDLRFPTTPTGVAHVPSVAGPVPTWTPALRRLTYLYHTFNHIMRYINWV
jgi:hypothetical protein